MKKITFLLLVGLMSLQFFTCTKDTGTALITYQEATAIYGDLDAIRNQPLNTDTRAVINPGKIFVGTDFILLGEEEQGIHVIDNADISNPNFINFINIPGNREFFVKDKYLYAESYYDLLKIDLSDLRNVQLAGSVTNLFQETMISDNGEALLGFSFKEVQKEIDVQSNFYEDIMEDNIVYLDFAKNIIPKSAVPSSFAGNSNQQSGTVNRITYSQEHIYVINLNNLAIVDDRNGSFEKINITSNLTLPDAMETIFPYKEKLFVGSRSAMNIYDASDPQKPYDLYQFDHATSCDPVLPVGEVAYITLRTGDFSNCPGHVNALVVLNIENLNSPSVEAEIVMKSPYGMTLIGDMLFVGEGENGLSIFDVTNRFQPELLKKVTEIKAYDVIAHPNTSGLVLIAGPDGLSQYTMNNELDFTINSQIDY